jgi:GntR family transcriptional repressor for pyruvate dehydrogenase complex
VEWGLLLGEQRTIDLVEARQKIEVDIAGLAAQRRTDDDLAELTRILARMEWEARDGAENAAFVDADVEFHLRLAEAAGNTALRDVLSSIQALLRAWIGRVIAEGYRDISYSEHVPILDAVRARDARAAEEAMDAHMRSAAGRLQATLDRASRETGVIDPGTTSRNVS